MPSSAVNFDDLDAFDELPVEASDYVEGELPFEEIDLDFPGIDPAKPTTALPGSAEKVAVLAARYASGLPLWHEEDCVDHGPSEEDLQGRSNRPMPPGFSRADLFDDLEDEDFEDEE